MALSSVLAPGSFAYGLATAAYQIEGATDADGRAASIWDVFAATPGATADGQGGGTACDSYHRVEEDAELVAGLGVSIYRLSVAWPRILPSPGSVESRGLDYYERVVDAVLARGVQPAITLYHWDLPQYLEDRGGWLERDTAARLADLAGVVHERLGDRVRLWTTLNEPWCSAYLGYAAGVHAPGRREGAAAHRAAHHLLLAHGLASAGLHEAGAESVGLTLNLTPVWPDRPEARRVADEVDAIRNRIWLDPLIDGEYGETVREVAPVLDDPELVREGDLALLHGSADWLGVNYYTPSRVDLASSGPAADAGGDADEAAFPGVRDLRFTPRGPRTDIGWEIEPRGLEELLVDTHRRTGLPLVVTENGAACADDRRSEDGTVDDADRIAYLEEHLAAVERARAAGADVRGYIAWTLMDNFEWAEGYTKTFGLVHLDRGDLTRTPKASYRWYAARVSP